MNGYSDRRVAISVAAELLSGYEEIARGGSVGAEVRDARQRIASGIRMWWAVMFARAGEGPQRRVQAATRR